MIGAAKINFISKFTSTAVAEVIRPKLGITAIGNAQIDTAQSKFGGSSALFDGTGDYLQMSTSPSLTLSGDFTLECWYRMSATNPSGITPYFYSDHLFYLANDGGVMKYAVFSGGSNRLLTTTLGTITSGTWYHVAFVRSGSTLSAYHNGTLISSSTWASTMTSQAANYIGFYPGSSFFNGHIDEYRISKSARYTTNFTPSTTPFVNDDNTLLLIHANGTDATTVFEDDNGVRRQAGVSTAETALSTAQSKFGGSSYYQDGTGGTSGITSKLQVSSPISSGTGNFTIEGWVRFSALPSTGNGGYFIYMLTGSCYILCNNSSVQIALSNSYGAFTIPTVTTNTWYHLALVRNSGDYKFYWNGVDRGAANNDSNWTNRSTTIEFANADGYQYGRFVDYRGVFNGYMDEMRISTTARYTSGFTPATAPFVNDANTVLLLHCDGTNGQTVLRDDNGVRAQNGIQAGGNAQIDTAQSKFGGSSALFDGNGDYLQIKDNASLYTWNSQPYTVELWCRVNALSSAQPYDDPTIIGNMIPGSDGDYWSFGPDNSGNLTFKYYNGGSVTVKDTGTMSTGVWYHIAAVIASNTITIYLDGVSKGSAAISGTPQFSAGTGLVIGWGASWSYNGWVDEVRVSNSARYTANFTPSTTPFQNDANTLLLLHMDGTDASTVFIDDNGRTTTP